MIFGLFLLAIIVAIYLLFIRGWLFKLIFFFTGWVGMYILLWIYVPDSHRIVFTNSNGTGFTWALVIPTIAALLAMLTTKSE